MNVPLEELRRVLGATHTSKLIKGLLQLGVPYRMVDGRPLVLRSAMERAMGGGPDTDRAPVVDMAARLARVKEKKDGTKAPPRRRPA